MPMKKMARKPAMTGRALAMTRGKGKKVGLAKKAPRFVAKKITGSTYK